MEYLKLLRIKHYLKNILVLFPLFFSSNLFNYVLLKKALLGFISFSLVSSIVYIINDIRDIENDRKHEIKKNRPLASGAISIKNSKILILILLITVLLINMFCIDNKLNSLFLLFYLLINLAYSFGLKNKPIIDILILSLGFLIRVLYGGAIIGVEISNWLYLTVLSASFYMSMGKRKNEIRKNGSKSRKVLDYYNIDFLDKGMYMFLSITLVFFSLWVFDLNNQYMIWTIPLVFVMCLKYSLNIENASSYGDPVDVLFNDKVLLIIGGIFALCMFIIMYFLPNTM